MASAAPPTSTSTAATPAGSLASKGDVSAEPGVVANPDADLAGPIVLYDGSCGLCAKSVQFILRHERDHTLRFAPLQGDTVAALRAKYPKIPATLESVVYIGDGVARLRSKAFMYISKHLRGVLGWGYAFRWMPGFLLDIGYRIIAAVRYRIWGRADACALVPPETRARFLP